MLDELAALWRLYGDVLSCYLADLSVSVPVCRELCKEELEDFVEAVAFY